MGQTVSSPRPRPTASGAEPDGLPKSDTANAPRQRGTIELPAPITIQTPLRHEREAVRGDGKGQTGSGPSTPDSAKAGLSPPLPENDSSTAVASDTDGSQNLRRAGFHHRRLSRSSSAMSDIEVVHPDTGAPVFRRASVYNRPALRIVDPDLIDVLESTFLSITAHIHAPYEVLFYSREKIVTAAKTKVEPAKSHAQLLLNFMETELTDTWKKCLEIENRECKMIAFDKSWLLYRPEETVFQRAAGGWRAYKVARIETGSCPGVDPISIVAYYLGFDKTGKVLVPHQEVLTVKPYPSEQALGNLDVVPGWYVEKYVSGLPAKLEARGELYWKYRGKPFYQQYQGGAWPTTLGNTSSKVIIDHVTSSMYDGGSQMDTSSCLVCLSEAVKLGPLTKDSGCLTHDSAGCMGKSALAKSNNQDVGNPLLYCPPMVWAFSLEHTTWKMVRLRDLYDVLPDEKGWERLLMDGEPKGQLDSMVSAYFREWTAQQELPDGCPRTSASTFGKRQGLSIHFHGGTGTGKTFTAECLAEKHGRPLYRAACGNIGTDPSTMESQLQRILLDASNWGAILLLENADLFVQDRDLHNLQRNALISILLHHLDFSDALVILATGHSSRRDDCFDSRVGLPLYFEPLSFGYQQDIWIHLLGCLNLHKGSRSLCEDFIYSKLGALDDGSYRKMNGWQIENCLRAALALAKRDYDVDGEIITLKEEHIKKVLRLGREFKKRVEKDEEPSAWINTPGEANG